MTMCPDTVINTVEDVKNNIETSVEIFIHTKENIQKIKDSMPKVGQLNGATRVHEVGKDGKTSYERAKMKPFETPVAEFAEKV